SREGVRRERRAVDHRRTYPSDPVPARRGQLGGGRRHRARCPPAARRRRRERRNRRRRRVTPLLPAVSQRSSPVACGSGVTVEVPAIRGSGILFRFPDSWHYFCAALSPSLLGEEEPTIDGPVARRATCSDLCLRRLPRPVRLPRVADPFDPPVGGGATV